MSLLPGARLGPYHVTVQIGRGGMGTVYRATDTVLGRSVAIKVLPDSFAGDADRLARFEREARTLAALNHPNIAQLYGFEKTDGPGAIVMELVDGPTLADRLAAGPIAADEALPIARQIAEALEAAHDHGVIHRDLKPANIKVRADGTVKLLDFGLAKALEPSAFVPGASMSPTITSPAMTHAGIVLGTAAYMSPEQARGKPVDRRADIWAFGCVLFEMLAGRRPFESEDTVSDTIAGILKGEPAWEALPADTPPAIRALLGRCLRKDVRRRLSHIAEARIAIEEADAGGVPAAAGRAGRNAGFVWPAIAAAAVVAALALAARPLLWSAPQTTVVRFGITPPAGASRLPGADGVSLDVGEPISPDGRTVAFFAFYQGQPTIWIRPLDSDVVRPLPETKDAGRPVWSPNSQSLAFVAGGQLKLTSIAGDPAIPIMATTARDLAWGPSNVILLGGDAGKPLLRVSTEGGPAEPATALADGEASHDYPHFLPDGRHFLYMARRGSTPADWDVYIGTLDSNERRLVRGIHSAARYSPTGHLLFTRDSALMAIAFDADSLEPSGEPFVAVDGRLTWPRATFSVSRNGTLAYLTVPESREFQLAWFGRNGSPAGTLGAAGEYARVRLSRDGRLVAFDRAADVFIYDLALGVTARLVSRAGADFAPVFSPAGDTIAFASSREPAINVNVNNITAGHLYTKAIAASGDGDILFRDDAGKHTTDWSADGRYLAYTSRNDIWALPMPMTPEGRPLRVTNTPFIEGGGVFSPDGRWIAYESNDSAAQQDVFVQSFPDGHTRRLVSIGGGSAPRWNGDGSELYYVSRDGQVMAVAMHGVTGGLEIQKPVALFESRALRRNADYDVSTDGRFLLMVPVGEEQDSEVVVVVNWAATLAAGAAGRAAGPP